MIIIELSNGKRHTLDIFKHNFKMPRIKRALIKSVSARDAVLEVIRQRFKNIPDLPESREVKWHGDIALFILDNLISLNKELENYIQPSSAREKYLSRLNKTSPSLS